MAKIKVKKNSCRSKDIVYKVDKNGCYICTSHSCFSHGYPQIQFNKKKTTVVRYLWTMEKGDPGKLHMRHKCDNKECINLEHIEPGTNLDNIRDKVERGRTLKGEKHQNSKLTWDAVRIIKKSNLSDIKLAKKFGVVKNAIYQVRAGVTWRT